MISYVSLYRSILRAHQKYLPYEMKQLGDTYVRSEFRLHNKAKPEQLQQFLHEWEQYLQQITITGRAQELSNVSDSIVDRYTSHRDDDIIIGEQSSKQRPQLFQFGKDLPTDIQLSEYQIEQLEKLKEEAFKRN